MPFIWGHRHTPVQLVVLNLCSSCPLSACGNGFINNLQMYLLHPILGILSKDETFVLDTECVAGKSVTRWRAAPAWLPSSGDSRIYRLEHHGNRVIARSRNTISTSTHYLHICVYSALCLHTAAAYRHHLVTFHHSNEGHTSPTSSSPHP